MARRIGNSFRFPVSRCKRAAVKSCNQEQGRAGLASASESERLPGGASAESGENDTANDDGDRSGQRNAVGGLGLNANFGAADLDAAAVLVGDSNEKRKNPENDEDNTDGE